VVVVVVAASVVVDVDAVSNNVTSSLLFCGTPPSPHPISSWSLLVLLSWLLLGVCDDDNDDDANDDDDWDCTTNKSCLFANTNNVAPANRSCCKTCCISVIVLWD
jgi:hypothetical protein